MKYAAYTVVYLIVLLVAALIPFGAGHGTPMFLFIAAAPYGLGLVLLPLAALAVRGPASTLARRTFATAMALHYVGALYGIIEEIQFHKENVALVLQDLWFIVLPWIAIYLAGQMLLWRAFRRALARSRSKRHEFPPQHRH